jgi:hypothetical protein
LQDAGRTQQAHASKATTEQNSLRDKPKSYSPKHTLRAGFTEKTKKKPPVRTEGFKVLSQYQKNYFLEAFLVAFFLVAFFVVFLAAFLVAFFLAI